VAGAPRPRAQSPRAALEKHGGWVIEVGIGDNTGGNRIKSQFVAFY
jgi:hypothetical protein